MYLREQNIIKNYTRIGYSLEEIYNQYFKLRYNYEEYLKTAQFCVLKSKKIPTIPLYEYTTMLDSIVQRTYEPYINNFLTLYPKEDLIFMLKYIDPFNEIINIYSPDSKLGSYKTIPDGAKSDRDHWYYINNYVTLANRIIDKILYNN